MSNIKDKDIKAILDNCTIIVDSREKLPNHITKYFDLNNINYKVEKLEYGDYGIVINSNDILDNKEEIKLKVAIERKMNLDEISNNLTRGRDRFKRELQRCVDDDGFMVIMIENSSYSDIVNKKYGSKLTPEQFLGLLHSVSSNYKTVFISIDKKESPVYVYNFLKYYARSYIKKLK